jgi:hypothetical protein
MNRQDRRKTRTPIGLEGLEGRQVLSTVAPINLDLQGTVAGVPSSVVGNPDVGTTVDFRGLGNVLGVGAAKLTGSLNGTGFFATSRVEGTITLADSKGSLALRVQGPSVGRFTAPGSGAYSYSIAKGTGAFKHANGSGTVDLILGSRSFTMTFQGKPTVG